MDLLTPPDREGCRWWIGVESGGRVRVMSRSPNVPAAYLVRLPRTLAELGPWLVDRGIDPERLEQI